MKLKNLAFRIVTLSLAVDISLPSHAFGLRMTQPVQSGLEEDRLEAIVNRLADRAREHPGVLVITQAGLEEHPGLIRLARHPELARRMILFSAVAAAQLAQLQELGVRVIEESDFEGLVLALLSINKADRVTVLEEAGLITEKLAKVLPPSMRVIHLEVGAQIKAILSAFIPRKRSWIGSTRRPWGFWPVWRLSNCAIRQGVYPNSSVVPLAVIPIAASWPSCLRWYNPIGDMEMSLLSKQERYYRKGKLLFRKLERRLKAHHKGKVVAIEPMSGAFVLGKDALEAALKAREQFPGCPVDFFRVGFPAVHKFHFLGGRFSPSRFSLPISPNVSRRSSIPVLTAT